ncbi:hypothetical protein C8034_v011968 [Colletotrichum sidae]|uniref:Uncharacterized protein n=1 Tax=Colletotrichum sidae TaxID=1347389 RepID=A0A4R8TKK5_9PEZI|nr:hypothetical protein C8034_v011968 [Colletotrichum sidae]
MSSSNTAGSSKGDKSNAGKNDNKDNKGTASNTTEDVKASGSSSRQFEKNAKERKRTTMEDLMADSDDEGYTYGIQSEGYNHAHDSEPEDPTALKYKNIKPGKATNQGCTGGSEFSLDKFRKQDPDDRTGV